MDKAQNRNIANTSSNTSPQTNLPGLGTPCTPCLPGNSGVDPAARKNSPEQATAAGKPGLNLIGKLYKTQLNVADLSLKAKVFLALLNNLCCRRWAKRNNYCINFTNKQIAELSGGYFSSQAVNRYLSILKKAGLVGSSFRGEERWLWTNFMQGKFMPVFTDADNHLKPSEILLLSYMMDKSAYYARANLGFYVDHAQMRALYTDFAATYRMSRHSITNGLNRLRELGIFTYEVEPDNYTILKPVAFSPKAANAYQSQMKLRYSGSCYEQVRCKALEQFFRRADDPWLKDVYQSKYLFDFKYPSRAVNNKRRIPEPEARNDRGQTVTERWTEVLQQVFGPEARVTGRLFDFTRPEKVELVIKTDRLCKYKPNKFKKKNTTPFHKPASASVTPVVVRTMPQQPVRSGKGKASPARGGAGNMANMFNNKAMFAGSSLSPSSFLIRPGAAQPSEAAAGTNTEAPSAVPGNSTAQPETRATAVPQQPAVHNLQASGIAAASQPAPVQEPQAAVQPAVMQPNVQSVAQAAGVVAAGQSVPVQEPQAAVQPAVMQPNVQSVAQAAGVVAAGQSAPVQVSQVAVQPAVMQANAQPVAQAAVPQQPAVHNLQADGVAAAGQSAPVQVSQVAVQPAVMQVNVQPVAQAAVPQQPVVHNLQASGIAAASQSASVQVSQAAVQPAVMQVNVQPVAQAAVPQQAAVQPANAVQQAGTVSVIDESDATDAFSELDADEGESEMEDLEQFADFCSKACPVFSNDEDEDTQCEVDLDDQEIKATLEQVYEFMKTRHPDKFADTEAVKKYTKDYYITNLHRKLIAIKSGSMPDCQVDIDPFGNKDSLRAFTASSYAKRQKLKLLHFSFDVSKFQIVVKQQMKKCLNDSAIVLTQTMVSNITIKLYERVSQLRPELLRSLLYQINFEAVVRGMCQDQSFDLDAAITAIPVIQKKA